MVYKKNIKFLFDFIISLLLLLVCLPIIFVLSVLVYFKLGSPILFRQARPGMQGKSFIMYKFRSMTSEKDENGELLPDSKRLTRFGKFLRSTSLDELPELINVLKGEMSLVGPRPLLTHYLELYSPEQARRHDVKPGITGLAQINGRNNLGWQDRFEMDVWYVDNLSFMLDLRIVFKTIYRVVSRDNVAQNGQATVEYFKGNKTTVPDNVK